MIFSKDFGRFSKVSSFQKVVEGVLEVVERLFRNVLSKRLGTQTFDCDKRVPKR